ncbi:radical SAM protein [Paenibacillus sp. M1]|uniref:Radical SAM protein n=1 Tax=Paenibacillus haidiansis TaxID=1574488 RepID=A0ABU7VQ90_9BACL
MKNVFLYYPRIKGEADSSSLYLGLPLSVLALAAQFDQDRFEVRILDGRLSDGLSETWRELVDDETLCLGISAITSYQIRDGLNLCRNVKEAFPELKVVWGGWHPSLMPVQTLKHDLVDIVITHQGEFTFPALVSCLDEGRDLESIPNLVYKDSDRNVISTASKPFVNLADTLPIERAYHLVNMNKYIQPLWGNKRVAGYESSRGCPYACKFCSISSVYRRKWNALPPERVADGVEWLYRNYQVDAIHFYDNNFFVDSRRSMEFGSELVKRGIDIKWDGTAVAEQFLRFSDEYIEKLKRSGFYRVIVGAESGDEDVLRKINKRHNNEQIVQTVKKCVHHGLQASLSFMVGFPWEPEKDFHETVKLIETLKRIDSSVEILLFIFSPYLGTPLYDIALEYGTIYPECLEEWADFTYERVNTPWISDPLKRKIGRYLSFFGTKDLSETAAAFFKGGDGN